MIVRMSNLWARTIAGLGAVGLISLSWPAFAGTGEEAAAGNIAWILTASALVLFMTLPGLALFYGGLVRSRNLLSVMMYCFAICCIASVIWLAFGYSLAFDPGGPLLGSLDRAFFAGITASQMSGLPEHIFALFQLTFAIITPALIVGAFPERVPFSTVLIFSALWLIGVYVPVAHWIWGGGWLAGLGAMDFAGGIVVHTTAGTAALVAAIIIGPRRGFPVELSPPHSPLLTMIGAGMLWVGWFGFNGGSALAANSGAGSAIIATHMAAAAGALVWILVERIKVGKPTSIGIATGCVAGLATVTPASGFVGPVGGLVIGAAGGLVCFFATVYVKSRLRIDDSLDVFAVHGVGGMLGSLLVSVFALPALGGSGFLAQGMTWSTQLGVQALAIVMTAVWTAVISFLILKLAAALTGLRVDPEDENEGLDLTSHGERAYDLA